MGTPVTPLKSDIFEEDISYRSAVSEELLRKIAASVNAINRDALFPLGGWQICSMPLAQFQKLNSNAWVLADGANITNTDYGQFLINEGLISGQVYLPDMRGMHPVGVNNGRADGKQHVQNPSLGGFVSGNVKNHTHTSSITIPTTSSSQATQVKGLVTSFESSSVTYPFTTSNPSGGQTQNTVNAVGVNYFIKVWNTAQVVP